MKSCISLGALVLLTAPALAQKDAVMFGGGPSRNMVNTTDKNIPIDFAVEGGKLKKVKWSVDTSTKTYAGPVAVGGKVYIGSNKARTQKEGENLAVLQCFDAANGKFLWEIKHPMPADPIFAEVTNGRWGLLSTPAIQGDVLYYVTPGGEVVAANTNGKVIWTYDMMKELKVVPYHCSNSCPLVVDDLIFLHTGNGIDEKTHEVAAPKAPSFIALKKDGKLAWQSNLPGDKIIEGQWTNPTLAVVNGKKQIIFPGGDGVIYSLKPEDGSLIWKFNCHPKGYMKVPMEPVPAYFVSTAVAHENAIYIGMGTMPEHHLAPRSSWFVCVDATRTGDISPRNPDLKSADNKGTGLLWAVGGVITPRPKKGRPVGFGPTVSTAAVHNGLVFITEEAGYLHCLDAKTGERHWVHDFKAAIWSSPYVVDGKVLVAVEDGVLNVLKADKKNEVLAAINMEEMIHSTPFVSDGTLFVMPRGKLYAIGEGK